MRANDGPGAAAWTVVLAMTLTLAACDRGTPAPEDAGEADAVEGAPTTAERTPATVDTSAPPPGSLLAIMIDLEKDMAGVAHGIWWTDWEAIATSATGIAEHPQIPDEGRATIAETLGEEMSAFAGLDGAVHDASVRIRDRLKPVLSGAASSGAGDEPGG